MRINKGGLGGGGGMSPIHSLFWVGGPPQISHSKGRLQASPSFFLA